MPVLAAGDGFGRYRIDGLLGRGGMGQVYRAYDLVLRRYIALKVVGSPASFGTLDPAEGASASARILREARAAAALSHPNAVAIFDVGETEGTPFIAMELVEGTTLRAHIGSGATLVPEKLRWLADVARVLDVAHAAGLVHRDIKPENVMVSRDGTAKVLDFGIARQTTTEGPRSLGPDGPPSSAPRSVLFGTPRYMAPEQLAGAEADGRCDQFSWGVVAYELLTGIHPASFGTDGTLVGVSPKPLAEIAPYLPGPVAYAVDRALSLDPDGRHPSMGTVDSLLEPHALPIGGASTPAALESLGARSEVDPTVRMDSVPFAPRKEESPPLSAEEQPAKPVVPARAFPGSRAAWLGLGLAATAGAWLMFFHGRSPVAARDAAPRASVSSAVPPRPPPAGPPIVLILEAENRTGDPAFDGSLELIVESSLKRSERIYPYARDRARRLEAEVVPGQKPSDETLANVIEERTGRPVALVTGSVQVDGSRYLLSFVATDGRSNVLARMSESVSGEQILPVLARFAAAIRTALGDPPAAEDLERSGMSPSLEADHEFAASNGELSAGKLELALSHIRKALELDPKFAMAEGSLGAILENAGRTSEAEPHFRASVAAGSPLSDRERLFFLAEYHYGRYELDEAIAAFEELVRRWPAETRHLGNLAAVYFAKGDFARARDLAERAVREHPSSVVYRANLVEAELASGDIEGAEKRASAALEELPRALPATLVYAALAALLDDKRDKALELVRRLRSIDPLSAEILSADLLAFEGHLTEAATALEATLADRHCTAEDAKATRVTLAEILLRQGSKSRAREAARQAVTAAELVTLYRAAHVLILTGSKKEAASLTEKIAKEPGERAALFARLLAAQLKEPELATAALEDIARSNDAWLVHAALAEAYLAVGAWPSADRELSTCIARRGEGASAFLEETRSTLRYVPPIYFALGRARDGSGQPGATAAYEAFLSLGSDDSDPLVREARRRMVRR